MTTIAKDTNVGTSFFGNVKSAIGDVVGGVGDTFREVFPVWAARELELQGSDNRFRQVNFNPATAPARIDVGSIDTTSEASPSRVQGATPQKTALLQFGGVSVSGLTIMATVIGVVAVAMLLRK